MTTILELIANLIGAMHRNDVAATARLLDALEVQMDPEELADLLEAILAEKLPAAPAA